MSSPFVPASFMYGDLPQGGTLVPMVIAGRNPSNTIDKQYAAGYLWLSSLDIRNSNGTTGSGNMYYQGGTVAGVPVWTLVSNSGGVLNTLSDGSITVSPIGGNIALEGTVNQITVSGNAASHNLVWSIPSIFIAPGSIKATTTLEVGTDLTVDGNATVTGDLLVSGDEHVVGNLLVDGTISFAGLSVDGTVAINTTGSGTTTVGNATAGAITIDVGTGNFQVNGGGNEIHIGDDGAANIIAIGSQTGAASLHLQAGTGDILIDGAVTTAITIGKAAQTGKITLGLSTAGEDISIGDGINVGAQVISIGNGASGANSTVNILSGAGSAGAGVLALGSNARVTTIGIGNVAPAAARVTTIAGGNQAQNDTVTVLGGAPSANSQIFNLLSGAASGGTQTVNVFSGNSAIATQSFNLFSGTGAGTINIGTGATGVKTIHIGDGTAANVIAIGSTTANASLALKSGSGGNTTISGDVAATITIGATAQTGKISIANSTAAMPAVDLMNGVAASAQVLNIASGASITGAQTVNILNGATPGASQTLAVLAGIASAGTQSVQILGGANTTGSQNFQLFNGAIAGATESVSIFSGVIASGTATFNLFNGNASGGTLAVNIFGDTAATTAGTIKIGTGAAAHQLTIGSLTSTAKLTLQSGTGGISLATGATTPGLISAPPNAASVASPTASSTQNSNLICTTFTGFTTASAATQDFTIVSSKILATSCIFVTVANLNASTNAAVMSVVGVTQAVGSIVVHTKNNGAGALGAGDNVLVNAWILS